VRSDREAYELEVLARSADGGETRLWSATLIPPDAGEPRAWQAIECPLPFASGDLVFRTRGAAEAAPAPTAPGWANPRVCRTTSARPVEAPPRNVIVFLMDTLRADHVGPMGHARGTTPNLDAIARNALVFSQASSTASWTKASVASLMTSRLPSLHGVEGYPDRLRSSEVTLAHVFSEAGYRTCAVGYNTWVFNPKFNLGSGFQDVFEVFDQSREGGARADAVVAEALDWILRAPEKPFFLYVHTIDPHAPYVPDAQYRARFVEPYDGELTGRLEGPGRHTPRKKKDISEADLAFLRSLYDAEIAFADAMLGQLAERLAQLGLWDETTLIFTSDHGEEFLDHGSWSHGGTLYQEQLHVPLVLKAPASAGLEARRCAQVVSLLDVAPTLCELARLPNRPSFTGRSLLEAYRGSVAPRPIVAELRKEGQHQVSVRDGDRKYIRTLLPRPREELYDLALDPRETQNVLEDAPPAQLAALRTLVDEHLDSAPRRGFALEFLGDGRAAKARVVVRGSSELDGDLIDGERSGDDLELRSKQHGGALVATLSLGETDRRDVLLFEPPPGEVLELELELDGRPIDPRTLLLGRNGTPASSAHLRLTPDDAGGLFVDAWPAWEPRAGVWLRLWRFPEGESVEFDDGMLDSLRDLGYVK
jgi:arylsulfatase A-like enzyme